MICPNCKAQLPDEDDPFCAFCGAPIPRPAPQPAPVPAGDQTRRTSGPRRSPLVMAAIVSSVIALVSVIVLVLVVIRPFDALEPAGDDTIVTPPTNVYPDDGGNGTAGGGSEGEGDGSGLVDTDTIIGVGGEDGTGGTIDTDDATDPADDAGNGTDADGDGGASDGTYVLADSDSRRYSAEELDGLSNWELYLARNEIYARHGREFRNDDLARYFSGQPWYEPTYSPDDFDARQDSILSDVERDNAQTILALEQARGSEYV